MGPMKKPPKPPPVPAAIKLLDVGETVLVTSADDLRGYNPQAAEQQIGRLHVQIQNLTAQHLAKTVRMQAVALAHGAALDDKAKVFTFDTEKMTLTRTK